MLVFYCLLLRYIVYILKMETLVYEFLNGFTHYSGQHYFEHISNEKTIQIMLVFS